MAWGTVRIAGIEFREEVTASRGSGGSLQIVGQEAHPPLSKTAVMTAYENLDAVEGLVVPVEFTDKVGLTAFYLVDSVSANLVRYHNGAEQAVTWTLSLKLVGTERDVEIESRVPAIGRITDLAGPPAPVFWHAPAIGYTSYFTGLTTPSGSLSRLSGDGPITVFTGIPSGFAPRWTIPAGSYMAGAVRLFVDSLPRLGTKTPAFAAWQLDNGLVRVTPGANGAITVSCWDPEGGDFAVGGWGSAKDYAIQAAGAAVTGQPEFTILRNDPEEVVIRLTYPTTTGRTTVDLALRRGSRFVQGTIKRHSATILGIARTAAETASVVTGGLRASAADAEGNRFVMGSAKVSTTTTGTASLSKSGVTVYDFFLGHEVGVAAAGDQFADLLGQYLGSTGERARVVTR